MLVLVESIDWSRLGKFYNLKIDEFSKHHLRSIPRIGTENHYMYRLSASWIRILNQCWKSNSIIKKQANCIATVLQKKILPIYTVQSYGEDPTSKEIKVILKVHWQQKQLYKCNSVFQAIRSTIALSLHSSWEAIADVTKHFWAKLTKGLVTGKHELMDN